MIVIVCSSCGARLRVSDDKAGKRGKCPKCQTLLTIPAPPAPKEDDLYPLADDEFEAQEPAPVSPASALRAGGSPRSAVAPKRAFTVPGEMPRKVAPDVECPSCHEVSPGAKICVQCGIHLPSGRPVVIARGIDEDMLEVRGSSILRWLSWIIPSGLYPVHSEAGGRHRPYVTWGIAILTILVSVWFWCYEWSDSPQMQSMKNLMLWPRHAQFDEEYVMTFYGNTTYGDREAFFTKCYELAEREVPKDQLARRAYEAMTPEQRSLGEFRWYQLFTHQLLHGGIMHLAGNLLFLLILGSRVNAVVGQLPMLVLYPLLGVVAGWEALYRPNADPIPSIGASGAIMGMAGMYLLLYPAHRIHMAGWIRWGLWRGFKLSYRFFAVRGFWIVLMYIAFDVVMVLLDAQDGVAHWAHIGGFVGGMVVALVLLAARLTYSGGDLLSLVLGRHAWPLLGTPHDRLARQRGP